MSGSTFPTLPVEAVLTRPGLRSVALAVADLLHDRWASLALLAGAAAILAPLLLLRGIENGTLQAMRRQFEADPSSREVLVMGSYDLPVELLADLRRHPDTGFLVVEPRYLNTAYPVRPQSGGRLVQLALVATAPGDPVLTGTTIPRGYTEVVLSERAATKLAVAPGDALRMTVRRRTPEGRHEALRLTLRVVAVLPEERDYGERGYVAAELLRAVELWREGAIAFAADRTLPPPDTLPAGPVARMRLYAKTLDGAPRLRRFLEERGIEAKLREERIATLLALSRRLDRLLALLAVLVAAGLATTLMIAAWHRVLIRRRQLAVLRLLAFGRGELLVYPVVQTLLLGLLGGVLALLAVLAVGPLVGRTLQASFAIEGVPFVLDPAETLAVLLGSGLLAGTSALAGGWAAARVEPAEVLHDV